MFSIETDLSVGGQSFCNYETSSEKQVGGKTAFECLKLQKLSDKYVKKLFFAGTDIFSAGGGILFEDPVDGQYGKFLMDAGTDFQVQFQSTGTKGLDPYTCGRTPKPLKVRRGRKVFAPQRIYLNHDVCPVSFRGTDQEVLWNEVVSEGLINLPGVQQILNSIERGVRKVVGLNFILGVYGSEDADRAHLHGIFAQAHMAADPTQIYYASKRYNISDLAGVIDGTLCINTLVGGQCRKWGVNSDNYQDGQSWEDSEELYYNTFSDLEADFIAYFNSICRGATDAPKYDVTFVNGELWLTARYPGDTVDLRICVLPCDQTVSWLCPEGSNEDDGCGIDFKEVQCPMPFPEVPVLFKYTRFTKEDAYDKLLAMYCTWKESIQQEYLHDADGSPLSHVLICSPEVKSALMLSMRLKTFGSDLTINLLDGDLTNDRVVALSQLSGTNYVMFTVEKNFIPFNHTNYPFDRFEVYYDRKSKQVCFDYEMFVNVGIKCAGAIGVNTCGSKLERELVGAKPMEVIYNEVRYKSTGALPCYESCNSDFQASDHDQGCNISGEGTIECGFDDEGNLQLFYNIPPSSYGSATPVFNWNIAITNGYTGTSSGDTVTLPFTLADLATHSANVELSVNAGICGVDQLSTVIDFDDKRTAGGVLPLP